jgi:phage terminase small subunit
MAPAPDQLAYSKLTEKQQAFVDALLLDPNMSGRAAAIAAGYAVASADVEASRLLRSASIRLALGECLKDTAPTANEIAARYDRVSRGSLDDFYTKKVLEKPTRVQQPLDEAIGQVEAELAFDRSYAERSAELLGLKDQALSDYIETEMRHEQQQRLKILRWEMELERNPNATRTIDGPPQKVEELHLDLVKAQGLGVLDLARSIKPTPHGIGIELRDPDAALDKLARMAGAYEKDNEQSATKITGVGITVRRASEKGGTNAA